jgi:hypothetical protein
MAIKRAKWSAGRTVTLEHVSAVLRGNPLGDPTARLLDVWLPPQYDEAKGRGRGKRFPVLFDLVGYTGTGRSHTAWRPFTDNVPEQAARLIHEGKMAPCIIVFPDCFTALGGNQYVNSSAIGNYADYLTKEIISFVDKEFRTRASREHRGCFGKSSGGYGAMIHGMRYARTLNELAKHRRRKRKAGRVDVALEERGATEGYDDGRVRRFLKAIWENRNPSSAEVHALMNLAMAATYDPDPEAPNGFRLPFNLETGEIIDARWRQWRKHDPIKLVGRYVKSLSTLRGIYIDCGWRDQYQIHFGSRILSKRLAEAGIEHRYEEFDGTHSGIDHRMDKSLPFLLHALR